MLRRIRNLVAAGILAVTPAITLLTPVVVHAAVDTCTWTGTVDGDFSNGGNWTGCDNSGVPENGDSLEFDTSASANDPVNDMSSMSFADITFSGTGGTAIPVSGLAFTLTGDIIDSSDVLNNSIDNDLVVSGTTTVTLTSSNWLVISGDVSGAGSITLATTAPGELDLLGNVTMTGSLTVNGGTLLMQAQSSADATVSSVTVANGATFVYDAFQSSSVTTYTLSTPINSAGGTLDFSTPTAAGTVLNLTGTLTLTADTDVVVADGTVVHVKGSLHGPGFKLTTDSSGAVLNESTDNTTDTPSGDINPAAAATTDPDAPGTPDTGFALVSNNPVASLAVTVLAAGSILALARLTRGTATRR